MMKKNILYLFIFSLFVLTGCVGTDDTVINDSDVIREDISYDGWQDYKNDIMGFELQIPSDWEIDERDIDDKQYRRVLFNIPGDNRVTALAIYMDEDRSMKKIRKETSLFEGIVESRANINGLEVYKYTFSDCKELDCSKDVDIPFEGRVYTLRFDLKYDSNVENIIKTLQVF